MYLSQSRHMKSPFSYSRSTIACTNTLLIVKPQKSHFPHINLFIIMPPPSIPPHILRLLSLIRSPPSPEHSSMASSLLLHQLSTRAPLRSAGFLWMIIGFVASFLYREDEKGRVSAARCLEAIAGLVPRASRDAFLAANKDPSASASDESTSPDSAQFLDVGPMVVDNCRIFELVLSKGMELNSRDWEGEHSLEDGLVGKQPNKTDNLPSLPPSRSSSQTLTLFVVRSKW